MSCLTNSCVCLQGPQRNLLQVIQANECRWTCANGLDCITCSLSPGSNANETIVSVDMSDCKDGTTSWICCRNATGGSSNTCDLSNCNGGTPDPAIEKCNGNTLGGNYTVDVNTTSIFIQVHDGQQAGNVSCGPSNAYCCGGGGSGCSNGQGGVCNYTIPLSMCSPPPAPNCTADTNCSSVGLGACEEVYCNITLGACANRAKAQNTTCANSTGDCQEVRGINPTLGL